MTDTNEPIYVSKPLRRNWNQRYAVYADRVELPSRMKQGGFVIPREEIVNVAVRPRFVIADAFRGVYKYSTLFRALKLDFADLYPHVVIERRSGAFRQFRFVPDDPQAFVDATRSMLGDEAGR